VCRAFTGTDRGQTVAGSRNISRRRPTTANAFSLPGLALSTADLYAAYSRRHTVRPAGQQSVDTETAYRGPAVEFGQDEIPMIGRPHRRRERLRGGLALYNSKGHLMGAIGVSGRHVVRRSQHCMAHASQLILDFVPFAASAPKATTTSTIKVLCPCRA